MKKLTKVLIISNEVVHVTFPMREKLFIRKTNYMFCIGVILLNKIGINVNIITAFDDIIYYPNITDTKFPR